MYYVIKHGKELYKSKNIYKAREYKNNNCQTAMIVFVANVV